MAYIYKITNLVNNKEYIGKTERTINQRWQEHIRESQKPNPSRALYRAIQKYGIDNFICTQIIETNNPEEDEKYYIDLYNTYKNGYNETLGGDGACYLNLPENEVCDFYLKNKNIKHTAEHFGCDRGSVKKILKRNNIELFDQSTTMLNIISQEVAQLDKNTEEVIKIWPSVHNASIAFGTKHIGSVCKGKRKTAVGFKWKYVSDLNLN